MIVDTSALFAILFNESDYARFVDQIATAQGNLSISVATQVEAHVVAQRAGRPEIEESLRHLIADYEITVVPVSAKAGQIAIQAHREYGRGSGHPARLNFGDCFAYALARERGEPLLFKGDDFTATDIASALG